jgi:molecular chaperone HscA
MTLLQISEPGQAPDPHQRRIAVGIDLGTTNSLVAAVRHGLAECLPDEHGRVLLPSAVRYGSDGERVVGWDALRGQIDDPLSTVVSVKRLMGRTLADLNGHAALPYELVDSPGMVGLQTRQGLKSPVEVSADILVDLRLRAEKTFGAELHGAVITVPAYFDDAQRQATKDAARLAGIDVLRLINEPTAAALAYGLDSGAEGLYAVYDLGGGTFDISLLRLSQGVFEVIATGGDAALGGDDFDHQLAQAALARSGLQATTPRDKRAVLVAARAAKEALTLAESCQINATVAGSAWSQTVTRAEFDEATKDLVARTMAVVRRVLRDAKVGVADVQGVVLVGGSTRVPAVRDAVAACFGRAPLTDVDPDQVVAIGAAIQANALAGNALADGAPLLLDVIPLSLGIETMGGLVERIVERNSTIPTAKAQEFTTYKDGQSAIAIHVVQGERERVADCRSLARFELRGIPAMVAGAARIRVTFQVDADSLLSVSAREMISGVETMVAVKPSYGLADDDIARMLRDGFDRAEQDMTERALVEARVDAQRLVLATESALAADGDLLTLAEREAVDAAVANAQRIAQGNDADAITRATEALAAATEEFAASRMNRGIRRALTGRRLEEV